MNRVVTARFLTVGTMVLVHPRVKTNTFRARCAVGADIREIA
jgi:hypothetical protein